MDFAFLGAINLLCSGYSKVNNYQLLKEAIKEIIIFQEQQINHLETLSIDIESLKQGPIFSAKIFLNDAIKEHRSEQECRELVIKAKEKFIDALGVLEAKRNKGFVDYHQIGIIQYLISLCWLIMLQKQDAKDWLNLSYETISLSLNDLDGKIRNSQDDLKKMIEEVKQLNFNAPDNKVSVGIRLGLFIATGGLMASMLPDNKTQLLERNYKKLEQKISKRMKNYEEILMFQQQLDQTYEVIEL